MDSNIVWEESFSDSQQLPLRGFSIINFLNQPGGVPFILGPYFFLLDSRHKPCRHYPVVFCPVRGKSIKTEVY